MPSRLVTGLIIAFWAATLVWFGYRDLWLRWAPAESPPFVIDLADEATVNNEVLWLIYRQPIRGGEPEEIGIARTYLTFFNADDTFELTSELANVELTKMVRVPKLKNTYRVTRSGELRSLSADGELRLQLFGLPIRGEAAVAAHVKGEVLVRSAVITLPVIGKVTPTLEDVPAPRGSVLNPLHPVSRIKGLSPGRRWQMPLVDPLADMVQPTIESAAKKVRESDSPLSISLPKAPKTLSAEVLRESAEIYFDGADHACHIIEYSGRDNEPPARTFVRIKDGMVLRQEASTMSERIYLQRVSARDKVRSKSSQYFQPKKP
jgi:hypothetical protein